MNRFIKVVVVMVLVLIVSICYNSAFAQDKTRCCDEEYPRLVVQGEGRVEAVADKAIFKVNVRVEEKKLERAFEESAKKINSLSQILTSFGIKKEDVRNLGYVYHPLYEGKRLFSSVSRPTSYEILYTLKVIVYSMDNLGKILTALSDITETTVYDLEYTSTKIEELRREALKNAALDAKEKAVKLSEGSGAKLGKVIRIDSAIQNRYESNRKPLLKAASTSEFDTAQASPNIESGLLEVIGVCTVQYLLEG